MVLWLKQKRKDILFLLMITSIVMLPYLTKDFLNIEHDTFFHVSRIEYLSEAISHGSFLPAIYPDENAGFGYASPLFYSDLFLIPVACMHLAGLALPSSYKLCVFLATFLSGATMLHFAQRITQKKNVACIASAAYLFSNYRITDIYVRGALGELFALIFLPMLLEGIYAIIEEDTSFFTLCFALTGLALSHNLTFLMGCFLLVIICICLISKFTNRKIKNVLSGIFFAFLLSSFFTLPMLEQLHSQNFIVDYYAQNSDLASGSMNLWQFFVNKTIFGYSGNHLDPSMTMTVNVGWFLTFFPLLYCFQKEKNIWITLFVIIGYITMLMPSSLIPWDILPLQILQFPWRLNTIALLLLAIPASICCEKMFRKKKYIVCVFIVLSLECIYHISPVYSRTFGLTSATTWQDVLDGKLTDPYYSAYYVRVELAGGDYLPVNSPDFRAQTHTITDGEGNQLNISATQKYNQLYLDTNQLLNDTECVLPKTWYLGYQVYQIKDNRKFKVDTYSKNSLVAFQAKKDCKYIVVYESTSLRKICVVVSCITLLFLLLYAKRKAH